MIRPIVVDPGTMIQGIHSGYPQCGCLGFHLSLARQTPRAFNTSSITRAQQEIVSVPSRRPSKVNWKISQLERISAQDIFSPFAMMCTWAATDGNDLRVRDAVALLIMRDMPDIADEGVFVQITERADFFLPPSSTTRFHALIRLTFHKNCNRLQLQTFKSGSELNHPARQFQAQTT